MRQYAWTVAIVVAKPGTCLTGLEVAIVAEKVHFTSSQSSSPKAELLQVAECFLRKRLRFRQLIIRASRSAKTDSQHSIILQHVKDSAHWIT